jgi:MFS transporter, ACS family, aldohexuronate transporter
MTRSPRLATKWKICLLLFLATTLNYLDRQTLSVLAPTLQKDIHLDNEALGWLFAVFYYTYTLSHFAVGPILDRTHLRWVFGIAVLAWSTVSMLTGLATGFVSLIVFRLLLGVMESANWPTAIRIVARTMPPSERALGNGIFTSGTSVGALIARMAMGFRPGWWPRGVLVPRLAHGDRHSGTLIGMEGTIGRACTATEVPIRCLR